MLSPLGTFEPCLQKIYVEISECYEGVGRLHHSNERSMFYCSLYTHQQN